MVDKFFKLIGLDYFIEETVGNTDSFNNEAAFVFKVTLTILVVTYKSVLEAVLV